MPTHNGWDVVFVPAYPPAPQSIDFVQLDPVAVSISPFTGQQQIQDWGAASTPRATWMEASVLMPPMRQSDAENWVNFLRTLNGIANVFQFGADFMAAYPEIGSRYWRLKSNARKWSVMQTRFYGLQFEIREAL